MVGCDVVSHLEDELAGKILFRRFANGNRLDVRSALDDDIRRFRGDAGLSMRLSFMRKCVGIWISGAFPSVRGSVIAPASADAAAVSGETR